MSGSQYYWFDITDDSINLPDDYDTFLSEYFDTTADTTANIIVITVTNDTIHKDDQIYLFSPDYVVEYRYDYSDRHNVSTSYLIIGYIDESYLYLNLDNYKIYGMIEGTDPLIDEFTGGIWRIDIGGYSYLDFSGGEVHEFDIHSYSHAVFSGGRIDEIWSFQSAWTYAGEPLELVPDPHIEIECLDWDWDDITNVLTGTWADFSTFDIQLVDRVGYDPVIENISFTIVPEPASLLLIAAGGLMLRRKE